jgi:hypothetical protein
MNYTNPSNPDYHDKPSDWLNAAMVFARAFASVLQENAGIVVDMTTEIKNTMPEGFPLDVSKLLVCNVAGKIQIRECRDDIPEGTHVMVLNDNPN